MPEIIRCKNKYKLYKKKISATEGAKIGLFLQSVTVSINVQLCQLVQSASCYCFKTCLCMAQSILVSACLCMQTRREADHRNTSSWWTEWTEWDREGMGVQHAGERRVSSLAYVRPIYQWLQFALSHQTLSPYRWDQLIVYLTQRCLLEWHQH